MPHTLSPRLVIAGRTSGAAVAVAGATVLLLVGVVGPAQAATTIGLGTAGSFVVLAGAGVTNTGPTTLHGDLGTYPTTSISGAGTMTITGTNHGGDAVTQGAKTDLTTAYGVAAGQGPTTPAASDLGGLTLKPGVYTSAASMALTGALTLDGGGDPNAVWVFQAGSTLTTASGSAVRLIGDAQACHVFWQVGSSATLGTGSTFRGTVLALTSITVTTGTTIEGRVLARNGAVTLDTDVITAPVCTTTPAVSAASPAVTAASPAPSTAPQVTVKPRGGVQTGDGSTVDMPGSAPRRAAFPAATGISALTLVPVLTSAQG